jgi:hypothetical protein
MDDELMSEIRAYISSNPLVRLLDQGQAEDLANRVAQRFGFVQAQTWWWETTAKPVGSVTYSGVEGLDLLLQVIGIHTEPLLLFVTDDHPPPWPCVVAPAPALVDMLREQRFF